MYQLKSLFGSLISAALILPSTPGIAQIPEELDTLRFSGPDLTPCPACLCAASTGEVFVGVDMLGSLGKGPGKGKIVRLVDSNGDGKPEESTVFTEVDNPRGLIAIGRKLYVLHTVIPASTGKLEAMHLSVFEDRDWNGVADGEGKILVSNVSPPKHNQARGADHTTNGIRLGIDGWIYIAVGDFGIVGAKGTDGTELTMLGGGVVRVRPDGSEMEVYTHGLRNIYDVAIDPFMNMFTRGNTNDGGGWNIRFIHQIQTGQYGYPMLFKHFTNEIVPALADLGGGSGTGALFLQEPTWPEKYNNVPLMCDWGRSQLIIHRVTPDGASFTQKPEKFIRLSQIADVDVDASGRLYGAAWDGAGYSGNPKKGYVQRYVPKGWSYQPFPAPAGLQDKALVSLLRSGSATARTAASQELLNRPVLANAVFAVALDRKASLESRVAAIFTYKQMAGAEANAALTGLAGDPEVREWVLRSLTDRKSQMEGVGKKILVEALKDANPRVQVAAAVGLGRLGDPSVAKDLLAAATTGKGGEPAVAPGPPAFESKVIDKNGSVSIDVDVSKFKELYLVVTDGGNGTSTDHAAWFDPVFVNAAGKKVDLKTLKWKSAKSEWGRIGFGLSATGEVLKTRGGKPAPKGLGTHADSVIVFPVPRGATRFQARGGLASTSQNGSVQFIVSDSLPVMKAGGGNEGPHATPNPGILLAHVAVKALVDLRAAEACVAAVGTAQSEGALWALRLMHDPRAVQGMMDKYSSAPSNEVRLGIVTALIRLFHREKPYDGSWWWGTRPDTHGPYYKYGPWEESDRIRQFVHEAFRSADRSLRASIVKEVGRHRVGFKGINDAVAARIPIKPADPTVDLASIAAKKGQIGKMSIEDVMLTLKKAKGDPAKGREVFARQGCSVCHTTEKGQPLKGPFMGQVGAILSPEQIAESILKPNASISQGFATVQVDTKDKKTYVGFVTAQSADSIEIRDIAGKANRIKASDVSGRKDLEISMMPAGLADALSIDEFASLVAFLASKKGQ